MLKPKRKPKEDAATGPGIATASVSDKKKTAYERHKANVASKQRAVTAANQELGELPPVKDPARKESCRYDLRKFIETYLRTMFRGITKRWAPFHLECMRILQVAFLTGGRVVQALPRGSAKSTLVEAATIWAAGYGHCGYAVAICAMDDLAIDMLTDIKTQLEVQPILCDDFAEMCLPVRALERKAQKAKGQTYKGISTRIEWKEDVIVLATIPEAACSGFRIATTGITGAGLRGLRFTLADGTIIRPDVVLLDDPQTDESARSFEQTRTRVSLIRGAVLKMCGPGESMAVVACVTVIQKGDLADQLLEDPNWRSMRHGILTAMPDKDGMRFWNKYFDIRKVSIAQDRGSDLENKFYVANREPMDRGVEPTWEDRFDPNLEISAVQHAMNHYMAGIKEFYSEYQNAPEALGDGETFRLDAGSVCMRLNGLPRYMVPLGFDFITTGWDVSKRILWYATTAWKWDMTGSIIDYGWLPDQPSRDFDLESLVDTLQSKSGAVDEDIDAAVSWGLVALANQLFKDRKWIREDGIEIFMPKAQIDVNYRASESAVGRFCRTSPYRAPFKPAMGLAVLDNRARISDWNQKPGQVWPKPEDLKECEWMLTNPKHHGCQEVYFDPNHWKSFVNTGFSLPLHSPGSLSIYGQTEADSRSHALLAQHLTSHFSVQKPCNGFTQTQWKLLPGVSRDDLLDTVVGSAVAASREGARLSRARTAMPVVKPTAKVRQTIEAEYL